MSQVPYETDFYAWLHHNTQLLREGNFADLDIANLVEELESMGRSEKREFVQRLAVLIMHLLKWQFQPQKRSRSWELTCIEQRRKLNRLLKESPSLKAKTADLLSEAYEDATLAAERETGIIYTTFPLTCPYAFEDLMANDFTRKGFLR